MAPEPAKRFDEWSGMMRISRRVVMVVSMSSEVNAHNRAVDRSMSPTNVARPDDTFWRASGATFGRCAGRPIARPALRGDLLDNQGSRPARGSRYQRRPEA